MRTIGTICCVLGIVVLLTGLASAAPIPVANSSFEDDSAYILPDPWIWQGGTQTSPSGTYGTAAPPDASSKVASASNGSYPAYDPDPGDPGHNRAAGTSLISQTLTTLAAPNTTYTLTIDALNANGANPSYPIAVIPTLTHADGSPLGGNPGGVSGIPVSTGPMLSTTWLTQSFTWTTDGTEPGAQFLHVAFATDNTQAGGTWFIDNVRLDDGTEAIPEPSALALLATGLVGLLARARRTQR